MLRHALFLLIACIPCITCQLIIGTCPRMNRFVKDLDYEKYSGEWYVIAQDRFHIMKAVKCQRVTYTPKGTGMTYRYNVTNEDVEKFPDLNGTMKVEGETKGELIFRLKNSRRRHYRVMLTDYERFAVEYTCMDGAVNYLAAVSILHRKAVEWPDLDTGLRVYNLTSLLTPKLKRYVKMVYHRDCPNEPPPYEPVV